MNKASNIIGATIFLTISTLIVVVLFLVVAAVAKTINSGKQTEQVRVIKKSVKTFTDQHGQVRETHILAVEGRDRVRSDLKVDGSVYRIVKIGVWVAISKDGRSVYEIDLEDHDGSHGSANIPNESR